MSEKQNFIDVRLIPLIEKDNPDRAVLADLRRGLGEFPKIHPFMYRHIQFYLPSYAQHGWHQKAHYLTAALFALHPYAMSDQEKDEKDQPKPWKNLGHHFSQIVRKEAQENRNVETIERRFTYLLAAHPNDLHFHLRQAISFLSSKDSEFKINWYRLLSDIQDWNDLDRRAKVQENWAKQFWRNQPTDNS